MVTGLSQTITTEQFSRMPDRKNYELVAGQLVRRAVGNESSAVGFELAIQLKLFVREHRLGWVFVPDTGFRLTSGTVRKPDVSFVKYGRLPQERPSPGYDNLAPDLAVEVISPHDIAQELDAKIDEYLAAGTTLVWVINPQQRSARVHRQDGSITALRADDDLTGEEVIPGFVCRLGDLFDFDQPPAALQE